MKNRTFIIIMTILGFIIIGSCALGVYSYHEMSQMDENAKMQTYITNLTGADLAKQKAEDEAELLRIEKERELALAEEEKRCIERENATKEKESESMNEGNETYDDRSNYSSSRDDSWMNGHWLIEVSGIGTMNYYIDTDRMRIKVYTTLYSEGRPHLDYNGSFTISEGDGNYRGYRVISYRDPSVSGVVYKQLADPNRKLLYDENSGYFRKMQ